MTDLTNMKMICQCVKQLSRLPPVMEVIGGNRKINYMLNLTSCFDNSLGMLPMQFDDGLLMNISFNA